MSEQLEWEHRPARPWSLLILGMAIALIFGLPHLLIPALQQAHGLEGSLYPSVF